ncbi:MAG: DUF2284 domain-containing protein [Oscillospiraceae bacterium]|nr:DUF2284 domain-containing protein [Oscillospiraceae bacterium]
MELTQLALDCGAYGAELLPVDKIVLNGGFRALCEQNSCGNYGKTYMCPPYIGTIEELMEQVRGYDCALLYQTVAPLEDSFDFEGMTEGGRQHALVSRAIHAALPPELGEVLHMAGGGCKLCERCAKADDLPCRHPEEALGSLSAYGVDVYNTAKATRLKYINGQNTVTYFGMVLFKERA